METEDPRKITKISSLVLN